MKASKVLAFLLALIMTVSAIPAVIAEELLPSAAKTAAVDDYFGSQLVGEEYKKFYNAMVTMAKDGIFAKGEDLDLVKKGYFTSDEVKAFSDGKENVLNVYGAARDAFTFDHPDIFYVDFSALSIRITRTGDSYHLLLGKGRRDSYFTESFKNADEVSKAIETYKTKFEEANTTVNANALALAQADQRSSVSPADLVEAAHDYITKSVSYRLEDKFVNKDYADQVYAIRTVYGSLVNGRAVCEGYARLFKAFMDANDIPCVLVQGAYRPDAESFELHMWTYVQIDGKWYAVDPTMDDPTNTKKDPAFTGEDGYENHEYLLKGDNKMAVKYAPSGVVSESNYEFAYPQLNYDNYGNEVVYNSNGLMVEFEKGTQEDGENCGVFTVSYKGMGLYEARKEGYYILYNCLVEKGGITSMSRSTSKNDPGYDKLVAEAPIGDMMWTGMKYIGLGDPNIKGVTPDTFNNDGEAENSDFYTTPEHLVLKLPQTPYVKFAVTTIEPELYRTSEQTGGAPIYDGDYHGTPDELMAESDSIFNKNGMYKAPPYPTEVSPTLTSALLIDDGKRTISAKFDKDMKIDQAYLKENEGRISLRMNLQDMYEIKNTSGYVHSVVDNFRLIFKDGSVSEPVKFDLSLIVKIDCHDFVMEVRDDSIRYFDGIDPYTLIGETIIGYQFDFTPSTMYADDNIFYEFDVKGIKGNSITFSYTDVHQQEHQATVDGKEPIAISFLAAHRCAAHAFQAQGYDWNVFGKPTLMDDLSGFDFTNPDFQMTGDKNEFDGLEALESLTHRMVLVATDANEEQVKDMDTVLGKASGGLGKLEAAAELENAEYYNINLTLCKSQIVSTGQAVRVTLGFPAGYGPEDKGKTFKVYHFSKDEKGNITGVNEIPCEITEFGLVVWCDSFSPFAIVPIDIAAAEEALAGDETKLAEFEAYVKSKSVIYTNNDVGGSISSNTNGAAADQIIVKEGQTVELRVTAEKGYVIDSITVGGKTVEVKNSQETVIELPFAKLEEGATVVDAQFVSASVAQSEADAGATAVKPSTTASKFKDGFSVVIGHSAELGGNIGLNFFTEFKEGTDLEGAMATVTAPNGTQTEIPYTKWNKDEARNAYKILCEVPAKDINGTVTMQITLADGTTTSMSYTYTVEQYLRALEDDPNFSDMKALVQAMRNYGEAAHLYFNGGTPSDPHLMSDDKSEIEKSAAKIEGTLPEGVTYIGSSLMLESTTAIRHYFTCTEETIANQYGMTKKGDVYYIESDNILAQNLAKPVTTTVKGFSITYSPMSYVNTVLKNASSDPSLAALVGILYRYYKAADAYAVANGAKQNG